jgi:hypothetical protein
MKMHAIIEIEEGTLNVVVGGRDGARTRVMRSVRIPLADLGTATIENALRTVGSDVLQGAQGVHVVIGDRRSQHFLSTLPKMASCDAVSFVTREALRLGNIQSADDMMVSTRLVRMLAGNQMQLGSTAVARSVWRPVATALENHGMPVLSLQTMESCLAMATDSSFTEPVAVLECNGSKARYVVSVDQMPVQVRRFMLGGVGAAGGDDEQRDVTMMTQLAMELPRTMDWLRETGQALPRHTWIGTRVGLSKESLEMLAGDEVGKLTLAPCDVAWDQELAAPSVGVAALLNRLSTGVKSASLLDPAKLSLPMNSRHLVSMFAAACVAIMGGYSAIVDGSEWFKASEHVAQVADDCDEVQAQLDDLSGGAESGSVMNTSPQLAQALTMRRPLSRLIGEISNSVSEGVSLEEIKFASTSSIVVSGQVEGSSRQDALTAMGHFTKKVHALEFVMAEGHDEVSEVVGQLNRFRFKLTLAWRN